MRTLDESSSAVAGVVAVPDCMPGCTGRVLVRAVRICTNLFAMSGAMFGELAKICSGVMFDEP